MFPSTFKGVSNDSSFGSYSRKRDEKTVLYALIDESGVPYYEITPDREIKRREIGGKPVDNHFIIDAIVTENPEKIGAISLKQPRHTKLPKYKRELPGRGELKHSDSNNAVRKAVMRDIARSDAKTYGVVVEKLNQSKDQIYKKSELYAISFEDLVKIINENGPSGVYRFRIDNSPYYDQDDFEQILKDNLDNGKILDKRRGVLPVDSAIAPSIQTIDIFVGEHKKAYAKNRGYEFEEKTGTKTKRRTNKKVKK